MEMVLSLGASMTATAATAGTAAAATGAFVAPTMAAGATAAAAGAAGSTLLGFAQGTVTAFSMLSTIGQGIALKQQSRAEAQLVEAEARVDKVTGMDEANLIRRRLAEAIGQQQVAYAAAGVQLGTGSPAVMQGDSEAAATRDITRTLSNSQIRQIGLLNRASALRARGKSYMAQSILKAAATGTDFLVDLRARG